MTEVEIKAPVYPTESTKKVKQAIKKLFPEIEIEKIKKPNKDYLIGKGDKKNLQKLKKRILEQKISDTARKIILKNKFVFSLNKQAATVGKINFQENAPLGTIEVKIKNGEELIDWLAPKTKEGEPIT